MNPEKQTPPTHDNKETTKENEPSNPPDPGLKPPDPDSQTISRPGTPAQTNQITVLPSKPTPKFIVRHHSDPRIKKNIHSNPLWKKMRTTLIQNSLNNRNQLNQTKPCYWSSWTRPRLVL